MKERFRSNESQRNFFPDVIFVLSSGLYGSEVNVSKLKLSWDARMRLVATADLVNRLNEVGHSPQVVVTGGNVYKGQPKLSSIGRNKLVNNYRLPKDQVKTVDGLDTIEEFKIIKRLIREQNLNPHDVAVISSGYHLTAKTLSKQLGVNFFSAEEILRKRNKHYHDVIEDIVNSDHYHGLLESQRRRSKLIKVSLGKTFYKIAAKWVKRNVELTPFDSNDLRELFGTKER